uniref:Uncharacterized protein n=1 Tax=Anguilla anguilla TaxID=7936 RepID=A0A0E9QE67_ANGAN
MDLDCWYTQDWYRKSPSN